VRLCFGLVWGRSMGGSSRITETIGYTWSYLACMSGHLVPICQPLIVSSFQLCLADNVVNQLHPQGSIRFTAGVFGLDTHCLVAPLLDFGKH
jgi:hypothetical protein